MADESLKGFVVSWVVGGLLLFSLLSFTFVFFLNNNPTGLGDNANAILQNTMDNVSANLYEVEPQSNELLNITAQTDPERSELGSRDSVATGYGYKSTSVSFWDSIKIFLSWVLTGDVGKVIITVVSGLLGFLAIYYIWGWIKSGR